MPANMTRFHCSSPAFSGDMRVYAVTGEETLSSCFNYSVEVVVPNDKAQPQISDLIDQPVLLQFDSLHQDKSPDSRLVHGIIEWMEVLFEDVRHTHYRLQVVPQLWRLTQRSDCRIFQFKTVPDIVTQVLKEAGFAGDDYKFVLQEAHAEREYCVQYRESDLNFVMRLLAEEGIYFFFEHEAARHVTVFADTPTIDQPVPGELALKYKTPGGGIAEEEHVTHFTWRQQVRTGSYTHTDYKFENPVLELEKEHKAENFGELARFDYPGRYIDPSRGQDIARFRLEQLRMDQQMGSGITDSVRFQVGRQFELTGHDQKACNTKHKITGIRIQLMQPEVKEELAGEGGSNYQCEFTCILDKTPPRTAYMPDKPHVYGPQTAIVVGPAAEEIYVDEHGRVKVQFHWDRYGNNDEHSSCWIRVSQTWAGAAYGSTFIPRIGHEVIVDFLEGDIDQPIITGRVYHGTNVPPLNLPAEKTRSTIKTQTHKGGGYNEIRFEDEAEKEEIFIHGQKDQNIVIENDRTDTVKNDETIGIGNDRSENVGNDETVTIGNNRTHSIGNDDTESVGNNQSITIGNDQTLQVGNNQNYTIANDESIAIGNNQTISTGTNQEMIVGAKRTITVTSDDAISVGGTRTVHSTGAMTIASNAQITLAVGGSVIEIKPAGIDISSTGKVTVNGSVVKIN